MGSPIAPIGELVSWREQRIDFDPPESFWAFNPSILQLPDGRLLCTMRCANYHRVMGLRLPSAITNRNFMLEIDPLTLRVSARVEMQDLDPRPRIASRIVGYDDLRLTWTQRDGLCAIANSAHFGNGHRRDMVALDLDDHCQIVRATSLVGEWSREHQKNWAPFVGTDELRLVYSVERGGVHTRDGRVAPVHGIERYRLRGGSQLIQIEPARDPKRWLGIAHGVKDPSRESNTRRDYWHVFYMTDDEGHMLACSPPCKLSSYPIEFAAGLALDPTSGRLIVSYGLEDDRAMLGIVELDAVLGILRPTMVDFRGLS